MDFKSHDMEVVAPFSFDKDIHDKIGTNQCNKFGRSGGNLIKEEEKVLTGRKDKEIHKNTLSSKDKVESGVCICAEQTAKEAGRERSG